MKSVSMILEKSRQCNVKLVCICAKSAQTV